MSTPQEGTNVPESQPGQEVTELTHGFTSDDLGMFNPSESPSTPDYEWTSPGGTVLPGWHHLTILHILASTDRWKEDGWVAVNTALHEIDQKLTIRREVYEAVVAEFDAMDENLHNAFAVSGSFGYQQSTIRQSSRVENPADEVDDGDELEDSSEESDEGITFEQARAYLEEHPLEDEDEDEDEYGYEAQRHLILASSSSPENPQVDAAADEDSSEDDPRRRKAPAYSAIIPADRAEEFIRNFNHATDTLPRAIEGYFWYCNAGCPVVWCGGRGQRARFTQRPTAEAHYRRVHPEITWRITELPERDRDVVEEEQQAAMLAGNQ